MRIYIYMWIYIYSYMHIYIQPPSTGSHVPDHLRAHTYLACTFTDTQNLRNFWKNDKMFRANTISIYEYTFVSKSESLERDRVTKWEGERERKRKNFNEIPADDNLPPPPTTPFQCMHRIHAEHGGRGWRFEPWEYRPSFQYQFVIVSLNSCRGGVGID